MQSDFFNLKNLLHLDCEEMKLEYASEELIE